MKDIKGYEGLYAITSCGKVWSYRSQKFLTPRLRKDGRLQVHLSVDNSVKNFLIHRLVAEAYIPNPTGLPQINHKDENPTHNYINNLEWCDSEYNVNYGTRNQRISKKVFCVELDKEFDGVRTASRELNVDASSITRACKGKVKTAGGYHWKYAIEE